MSSYIDDSNQVEKDFKKQMKEVFSVADEIEPTSEDDERMLQLIQDLDKKNNNTMYILSLAASILLVTFIIVIQFKTDVSTNLQGQEFATELESLIKQSQLIEQDLQKYKVSDLHASAIIEIMKVKNQVAEIDEKLNELYITESEQNAKFAFWSERNDKLRYLLNLYNQNIIPLGI